MSEINLKPIKNLVLVEVENDVTSKKELRSKEELAELTKTSDSGIILSVTEEDAYKIVEELTPSNRCRIVRTGSTVTEVKENDYCMFNTNGGHELSYGGVKYKLIREDDILLIIEP